MTARGILNNNPGNIRKTDTIWLGERIPSTDKAFEQFTEPYYGIRALAKVLLAYNVKRGLKTIREMIWRWAPPQDNNDTEAYVRSVSQSMGIEPDMTISLQSKPMLTAMVCAIIKHENGIQPYEMDKIRPACDDALGYVLPKENSHD